MNDLSEYKDRWFSSHAFSLLSKSKLKLVILTKPTCFVEEDKILAMLFEAGLEHLHLYKENTPPVYYERLLSLLPEECHRKIVVHDHFYLKEEYGLGGIHLDNGEILPPKDYKGNIGRTSNSLEQLKEYKKNSKYVFLTNALDGAYTIDELKKAANSGLIDKKTYATGHITLDKIKAAKKLGFGGVVVCNELWNYFDIHKNDDFKDILEYFEKLKKAING